MVLPRLLGGLMMVSMSELILSLDWVTLANEGTPMLSMAMDYTLMPFKVLCMKCRWGIFLHLLPFLVYTRCSPGLYQPHLVLLLIAMISFPRPVTEMVDGCR